MSTRKKPANSSEAASAKKPAVKKAAAAKGPRGMAKSLPSSITMTDLKKQSWRLGPVIGQGGFGYIYLGGPEKTGEITEGNAANVIKVEPHANGPLFVELSFYRRVAQPDAVSSWLSKRRGCTHLGIPRYIGEGSFDHGTARYRFMIMDRYGTDVEKIFEANGRQFPEETVFSLGLRIVDALEYIHEQEYVHADIKSSNLMMGFSKSAEKQVFLLDYGLAYRYCPNGEHKPYKEDPKRKHDGTLLYTSIDAHKGLAPARRSDLEILGYVMLEWLCSRLPWGHITSDKLADKEAVMRMKVKHMSDIDGFMQASFNSAKGPVQLKQYMERVRDLSYEEKPDYESLRNILRDGLKKAGHSDDGKSVILPRKTQVLGKRRSLSQLDTPSPMRPEKRPKKTPPLTSPTKSTPAAAAARKPAAKPTATTTPKAGRGASAKSVVQEQAPPKSSSRKTPVAKKSEPLLPAVSSEKTLPPVAKVASLAAAKYLPVKKNDSAKENVSIVADMPMDSNAVGSNAPSNRVVYKRPRKRNVPTADFAQSP